MAIAELAQGGAARVAARPGPYPEAGRAAVRPDLPHPDGDDPARDRGAGAASRARCPDRAERGLRDPLALGLGWAADDLGERVAQAMGFSPHEAEAELVTAGIAYAQHPDDDRIRPVGAAPAPRPPPPAAARHPRHRRQRHDPLLPGPRHRPPAPPSSTSARPGSPSRSSGWPRWQRPDHARVAGRGAVRHPAPDRGGRSRRRHHRQPPQGGTRARAGRGRARPPDPGRLRRRCGRAAAGPARGGHAAGGRRDRPRARTARALQGSGRVVRRGRAPTR